MQNDNKLVIKNYYHAIKLLLNYYYAPRVIIISTASQAPVQVACTLLKVAAVGVAAVGIATCCCVGKSKRNRSFLTSFLGVNEAQRRRASPDRF
jgi:hypothetical protein